MVHDSAVFVCPAGSAGALGADESVFEAEDVIFERCFIEEVSKFILESGLVTVIADGDCAILDAEGVGVVFSEGMTGDFGGPSCEILTVEDRLEASGGLNRD